MVNNSHHDYGHICHDKTYAVIESMNGITEKTQDLW